MSFSRISSTFLLHEHDPTMDARIVHAVNVSNKKEMAQLKHKSNSLAGSRDVSMHIYRQEEKELVKNLFKLQQEKVRRHPEINLTKRHSPNSHPNSVDRSSEKLIKSLDFHHSGSATHHERVPRGVSGSNASLLQQYVEDPIYQPVGYGHGSQEYVGVPEDIVHGRQQSEADGKLGNHATTSQTAISHPAIANALPSRHLITTATQPHRQQSKTMAYLEPQLKKASVSSVAGGKETTTDARSQRHAGTPVGSTTDARSRRHAGTPVGSTEALNLQKDHRHARDHHHQQQVQHHSKRRTVAFDVKSATPSSPSNHEDPELVQENTGEESAEKTETAAGVASLGTSLDHISIDDPYELHHHKESVTRAIIDQEHHKMDDIIESFRKSFPVKKELDWQKTHPRPSPSSQRGPFKAHTPPTHGVSSQDSSVGSMHRHDSHGTYLIDHSATHVGGSHANSAANISRHRDQHVGSHANLSRHRDHQIGSHANISHHRDHHGHAASRGSLSNVTHSRDSHFNVARHQRQSHANMAPHSGSQASVGRHGENLSIYNLPKEAVEDFRHLMQHASHSAQHPSTRDPHTVPHHRSVGIPHSHPPKGQFKKSRQKLLALHLLANKQRQQAAARQGPPFDPVDTLMCRYLRLSALNVETLVDMCNEAGVNIGIHPHMSIDDVANMVFQPDKHYDEGTSGANLGHDKKEQTDKDDIVKSDENQREKQVTSDSSHHREIEA